MCLYVQIGQYLPPLVEPQQKIGQGMPRVGLFQPSEFFGSDGKFEIIHAVDGAVDVILYFDVFYERFFLSVQWG